MTMNQSEEKNLEFVRGLYAAYARGDMAVVLDGLADDVDWFIPGDPTLVPSAGRRRGKAEVMQCIASLNEMLEFEMFDTTEFLASGDKVVVFGRSRDRIRATGRRADNEWVTVLTMRDGKVAQYRIYEDTAAIADALRSDERRA